MSIQRQVLLLAVLIFGSASAFAQYKPPGPPPKPEPAAGSGMSLITPGLMQMAQGSNFFLRLADQIQLTEKQRGALEAIAYDFQKHHLQKLADLRVSEAEIERLLTRGTIELDAVRAKIRESEAISAGMKIREVESLLKAVTTLTHEQHLKVVILIQELQRELREAERPSTRSAFEPRPRRNGRERKIAGLRMEMTPWQS